uniref:Ribosomal protein S1 n=1 Tax=Crouania attenuata TaxID=42002 RepID=A0A4D6WST7_9FLOR|nr:ribosomal protein S1 [Crouania attenuata]
MTKILYNTNINTDSFASILNQYNYKLHTGDIVAGIILSKERNGFLVDIGDKFISYLPNEELALEAHRNFTHSLSNLIHEKRDFFLLKYDSTLKQSIVSVKRIEYIRGWQRIKQFQNENIIFYLPIHKTNKGGIITSLEGIQGFIPNSQIAHQIYTMNTDNHITCTLLLSDEKNNQIICSHKSALLLVSEHKFRIGEIIYGQVKKIQQYGLFIQVKHFVALLHISEIGFKYITDLNKIFKIDQIIKVKIIHINIKQGRLSLSRRYIN